MQELGLKDDHHHDDDDHNQEQQQGRANDEESDPSKPKPQPVDQLASMARSPLAASSSGKGGKGGSNSQGLVSAESKERGSVPLAVYVAYLRAARSLLLFGAILLAFGLSNAADKISQARPATTSTTHPLLPPPTTQLVARRALPN